MSKTPYRTAPQQPPASALGADGAKGAYLTVHLHSTVAPLQWGGVAWGHRVYFRARHEKWRLELDGLVVAAGPYASAQSPSPGAAVDLIWDALGGLGMDDINATYWGDSPTEKDHHCPWCRAGKPVVEWPPAMVAS